MGVVGDEPLGNSRRELSLFLEILQKIFFFYLVRLHFRCYLYLLNLSVATLTDGFFLHPFAEELNFRSCLHYFLGRFVPEQNFEKLFLIIYSYLT